MDKGEWKSTLAYSSASARKKVYEQSIDVNEIFLAVWCLSHHSPPRNRHPAHRHTHNQQKHNPRLPGPSLPPGTDRSELPLGRGPAIWSGPGAGPCSSRVVGGAVLASLPSLSGPKRGCIWVSLGGAGPARDQRLRRGWGERGGDDSIFQVFGFSEIRPVQLLTSFVPSES